MQRRTTEGFARGHAELAGLGAWTHATLRLDFENENLVAWLDDARVLACVPDIITCVEVEGARAAAVEGPGRRVCARAHAPTLPLHLVVLQAGCLLPQRSCGTGCASRWWACRRTRC